MPSAIDAFRAQREAAEGIYAWLEQTADLLARLRQEADAIAHNDDLRAVLQREESWLAQAERTVAEVREWRERDRADLAEQDTTLGCRAGSCPCVGLGGRRGLCLRDETMGGRADGAPGARQLRRTRGTSGRKDDTNRAPPI